MTAPNVLDDIPNRSRPGTLAFDHFAHVNLAALADDPVAPCPALWLTFLGSERVTSACTRPDLSGAHWIASASREAVQPFVARSTLGEPRPSRECQDNAAPSVEPAAAISRSAASFTWSQAGCGSRPTVILGTIPARSTEMRRRRLSSPIAGCRICRVLEVNLALAKRSIRTKSNKLIRVIPA
jgi:hypothetical protein